MNSEDLVFSFAKEHLVRVSSLMSLPLPAVAGFGFGVKALNGQYQMINTALESLIDRSSEQITGSTDGELFPPEVAARVGQVDRQIIDGAVVACADLDVSLRRGVARYRWIEFPLLDRDGRIHSIGTVIVDVSTNEDVANLQQSLEELQRTNLGLQRDLAELDHLASTDKLTGAWNRRRLEETVISELDRLKRYSHPLSVLIIDIDFFKMINDDHGHVAGDQVLVELAAVIRSSLRIADSLTRWGGEEFVVLSPNTTLPTMMTLAERLRDRVATAVFLDGKTITVSIGVAECLPGQTWEQCLKRADEALYRAKAGGRNQVQVDRDTPRRVTAGENVSASLVQLTWHSAYECGNPVVDDQHRTLFLDANNLISAMLSERPADEMISLIDVLMRDAVQHFKDEEGIFTAAGFPDALEHAAAHRQLIDNGTALVGRFREGTLAFGELFEFLAHDVVAKHLLKTDRKFFPYLRSPSLQIETVSSGGANAL